MLRRSYTGGRGQRQLRSAGVVVGAALLLGGCAGMNLPFGVTQSQAELTPARKPAAALVSAAVTNNVAASDWSKVRQALAVVPANARAGSSATWHNPETGTDGTVTVAAAVKKADGLCRAFSTTVNDPRGISAYRGNACLGSDGRWYLSGVRPDDGTSL